MKKDFSGFTTNVALIVFEFVCGSSSWPYDSLFSWASAYMPMIRNEWSESNDDRRLCIFCRLYCAYTRILNHAKHIQHTHTTKQNSQIHTEFACVSESVITPVFSFHLVSLSTYSFWNVIFMFCRAHESICIHREAFHYLIFNIFVFLCCTSTFAAVGLLSIALMRNTWIGGKFV